MDTPPRMHADAHEILRKADLGPGDFDLLSRIHDAGFASFIHGSAVLGRMSSTSDIDFTLIGEMGNLPTDIRKRLLPGVAAVRSLVGIDYIYKYNRSEWSKIEHTREPSRV